VRLQKAHLLDGARAQILHTSRREMLRTLGRGAAVVVPLVTAITVPTSAQAQATGCLANGMPCISNSQCCSGNCQNTGTSFVCNSA
jgi:hypothetical protein